MPLIGNNNAKNYEGQVSPEKLFLFCSFDYFNPKNSKERFNILKEIYCKKFPNRTICRMHNINGVEIPGKTILAVTSSEVFDIVNDIKKTFYYSGLAAGAISFVPFKKNARIKYINSSRPLSSELDYSQIMHFSIPNGDAISSYNVNTDFIQY